MNGIDTIFKTAEKLFSEKSFSSVSMDQIAQKSGMSKGNLYHHFESKEDLYNQLLLNCHQQVADLLKETESIEGTYLDKIRFFVREHLKILMFDPQKTKLLLKEFSDLIDRNSMKKNKRTFLLKNFERITNLIDQAKNNNEITRTCDSKLLALQFLFPTLSFLVFQSLVEELTGESDPQININLLDQMIENLINGLVK